MLLIFGLTHVLANWPPTQPPTGAHAHNCVGGVRLVSRGARFHSVYFPHFTNHLAGWVASGATLLPQALLSVPVVCIVVLHLGGGRWAGGVVLSSVASAK